MSSRLFHKTRILSAFILLALIGYGSGMLSLASAGDGGLSQSRAVENEEAFMGRWIRPDGGYILELSKGREEGTLRAFYYNPRPINVARAEFTRNNETVAITVELRDVNYPGSKYNLRYNPRTDHLVGTYFQALHGETYRVEFMRIK